MTSAMQKKFKKAFQDSYREQLPIQRQRGLSANMADYVAQQIAFEAAEQATGYQRPVSIPASSTPFLA